MWIFIAVTTVSIVFGGMRIMRQPISKPGSHKIDLPSRPFTAKDIPVLKAKVNALNSDAAAFTKLSPRLSASDQKKAANVWDEIFYTPGYYPAFVEVRTIEIAKVIQHRPDLADHLELVKAYEDGRYAIANNPSITDKAGAIRAMEARLGPGLKNPEYARHKAKFVAARRELTGDPELDQADLKYQRFMRAEIVKRLPELADHFRNELTHYEAWTARVAEANALAREIKALETTPAVHARSK